MIFHTASAYACFFLKLLPDVLHTFQPPFHQLFVHEKRQILFVVIIKLLIRVCTEIADLIDFPATEDILGGAIESGS